MTQDYLSSVLTWHKTGDAELIYRSQIGAASAAIRLNDFPAEPMYTLLINDQAVQDFDDWPAAWQKMDALPA